MSATYPTPSTAVVQATQRVSWGAIFVGVVVAMVVQLLLGVLGIAIGASVINPMQEGSPVQGIGTGAGIYWVVSAIIALFAGGFAAGALTTIPERRDRSLHGFAVWGVATLLAFLLVGSGVGRLVGGTASLLGGGASLVGDVVTKVTPHAVDAVQKRIDENDMEVDLEQWRQEVRQVLRQSGVEALQPGQLEAQAEALREDVRSAARDAARNPQRLDQELESLLDRIQREGRETLRAADREALVNIIVARTGQSREEAAATVANWEEGYQQVYQTARAEWEEAKATAERKAREWGAQAADAVAQAAWWTFLMLLLGAIAATVGANVGANRVPVVRQEVVAR